MSESSSPEHIQELLAGYVLGDLSPEEAEELKRLLQTHPELVEEVNQLQEVLAAMPYSLPATMPSPSLRSTILETAIQPTPNLSPRRSKWNLLPLFGGGIAALIAVVLGFDNYLLKQQLAKVSDRITKQQDLIAMLQESQTKLVSLKGMDDMKSASGNVILTPGHSEAILLIQNLPVLSEGKSYQLWCVVQGKKIASGNFNSNPQKKVFVKVPFSVTSGISSIAVTVEVSPNPPIPQGPMVMKSSI